MQVLKEYGSGGAWTRAGVRSGSYFRIFFHQETMRSDLGDTKSRAATGVYGVYGDARSCPGDARGWGGPEATKLRVE